MQILKKHSTTDNHIRCMKHILHWGPLKHLPGQEQVEEAQETLVYLHTLFAYIWSTSSITMA